MLSVFHFPGREFHNNGKQCLHGIAKIRNSWEFLVFRHCVSPFEEPANSAELLYLEFIAGQKIVKALKR